MICMCVYLRLCAMCVRPCLDVCYGSPGGVVGFVHSREYHLLKARIGLREEIFWGPGVRKAMCRILCQVEAGQDEAFYIQVKEVRRGLWYLVLRIELAIGT